MTFGLQVALHRALNFRTQQTLLGSIGGLTSLRRPTHEESKEESVIQLYKKETLVISLAYAIMASISALTKMKILSFGAKEAWESWLSQSFVCLYFLTTQIYTRYLSHTLFSIKSSKDNAIELEDINGMNIKDTDVVKQKGVDQSADTKSEGKDGTKVESRAGVKYTAQKSTLASEFHDVNQNEINETEVSNHKSCEQAVNAPNADQNDILDDNQPRLAAEFTGHQPKNRGELFEVKGKEVNTDLKRCVSSEGSVDEACRCTRTCTSNMNEFQHEGTSPSKAKLFHQRSTEAVKTKILHNNNWIKIMLFASLAIIGLNLTLQIHSLSGKSILIVYISAVV